MNEQYQILANAISKQFESGGLFEGISGISFDDGSTYTKESLEQIAKGEDPINHVSERHFMFWCNACQKCHRMILKPCPSCGGGGGWTPQPVSDRVADTCSGDYACDGCIAYRDHLR